ncbi:hypothetical protein FCL47_14575 [Desulfopila sp. IMCC35006]|uniref:hypothetical protein n=1 Tax=Desulfopila sp. IMCC35006 TaxID=2569542 RepID=UPI0010AC1645|nr:hypothetical protein [Desulfopila sp. IMCC35006]TKB25279.1 hypothetical protein FCL47_14575 [Desulfopila sp. IMCC35006]
MKNTVEQAQAARDAIQEAANRWQGDFLTRPDVKRFTGGAISTGHLANLDSKGNGPEGAFYLGRKIVYPKNQLSKWLQSRIGVK